MPNNALRISAWAALTLLAQGAAAAAPASFDLSARLQPGDRTRASMSLKLGGEMITPGTEGKSTKLPISVVADIAYDEQLLAWVREQPVQARALRRYAHAKAAIKVDDGGVERLLPEKSRLIVAAHETGRFHLNGLEQPLEREQLDLVRVVADTLALDRLLPNRRIAEGESWDHEPASIAALLGFDHVAMCKVKSTVLGAENGQVKLKLKGQATGAVDGAAAEVELQAAYLYHLRRGRITKFNLAIKEHRKPGQVSPGLDVVAKLSLTLRPIDSGAELFEPGQIERASQLSTAEIRQLAFSSPSRGCRFRHADDWYVTAVQPDLMSLRLLYEGELLAHCNIRTLPVKITADQQSISLPEFEADIRRTLGEKLREISSATEWETPAGNLCLGVFADGEIDDVPIQWRYYLISQPGKPQISVSVTVERSQLGAFADADRILVDSLELLEKPKRTASRSSAGSDEKDVNK